MKYICTEGHGKLRENHICLVCVLKDIQATVRTVPYLESIIKWSIIGIAALWFHVVAVADPLIIRSLTVPRDIVPINSPFVLESRSIKPWTSLLFCKATGARMEGRVRTTDGLVIQIIPQPEPFGYNKSADPKRFQIIHTIPTEASVGDTIYVWKVVKYSCLGVPREVQSPETKFKVGQFSDNVPDMNRIPNRGILKKEYDKRTFFKT